MPVLGGLEQSDLPMVYMRESTWATSGFGVLSLVHMGFGSMS